MPAALGASEAVGSSGFTPLDPAYAARVRDSFERQAAMRLIGAALIRLSPGHVDIHLPFRSDLTQQHGFIHGGIIGMIADSASGYAGYTLMPADTSVLTVEYKINLLSPAQGTALIARGRVIKPGRTLVITQCEVVAVQGGAEKQCAVMQQTLMVMHGRDDHAETGGSQTQSQTAR